MKLMTRIHDTSTWVRIDKLLCGVPTLKSGYWKAEFMFEGGETVGVGCKDEAEARDRIDKTFENLNAIPKSNGTGAEIWP